MRERRTEAMVEGYLNGITLSKSQTAIDIYLAYYYMPKQGNEGKA